MKQKKKNEKKSHVSCVVDEILNALAQVVPSCNQLVAPAPQHVQVVIVARGVRVSVVVLVSVVVVVVGPLTIRNCQLGAVQLDDGEPVVFLERLQPLDERRERGVPLTERSHSRRDARKLFSQLVRFASVGGVADRQAGARAQQSVRPSARCACHSQQQI